MRTLSARSLSIRAVVLLLVLGTLLPGCGGGGSQAPAPALDLAGRMDAYLQAAQKLHWFTGSVLVARGGQVLLSRGYGMANYELDVPNTPQTKFRLGSVTKQFTSMAIMQLETQGRLKVTDTVKTFFPDYPKGDKITIRHLLTHTSGVPNFTDLPEYLKAMTLPTTPLETVAKFKNLPLDFAPGEKWNYSNSGYILLGAIIEKVTGGSYEKFVRENIFRPLGMNDSGYDHAEEIIKNRASGYEYPDDKLANCKYVDMSIPYAAGSLYSTVEDLYKWDRALYTEKLLPKAALEQMFRPFEFKGVLSAEPAPTKASYAYGWMINSYAGHKEIHHSGGVNGFTTDILRFPDDDACVIVLNNSMTAYTGVVSRSMADYLFGQTVEMPAEKKAIILPAAVLDAYAGRYQPEGAPLVFTLVREGDGLFIQVPGQPRMVLSAESETTFFIKSVNLGLTFVKDASGKVTHFLLLQGKQETKAIRLK
jgi:CubicO group peptidase (beta-lactamase class C family)